MKGLFWYIQVFVFFLCLPLGKGLPEPGNGNFFTTLSKGFDFAKFELAEKFGASFLKSAATGLADEYAFASDMIQELEQAITDLITTSEDFFQAHVDQEGNIDAKNLIVGIEEKLSIEVDKIVQGLLDELKEPPPQNQTEGYKWREAAVDLVLNRTEDVLVDVFALWNTSQAEFRGNFGKVKPHIRHVVLVIGNIAENHPVLRNIIFSVVVGYLIKNFLFRPLLRIFGWGSLGPVKGSIAASTQRLFFKSGIMKGSWFADLQSISMKLP